MNHKDIKIGDLVYFNCSREGQISGYYLIVDIDRSNHLVFDRSHYSKYEENRIQINSMLFADCIKKIS